MEAALTDIASLTLEQLTLFVTDTLGEKPYRAKQLYQWMHQRGVLDFAQMTDLSKALRERLSATAEIRRVEKDLEQRSADGTIKTRFRLHDGSELRERLLTLSDLEMTFSYCLLDTPIPLFNYVAHVRLLPVTDGNRTFWLWEGRFTTRRGEEAAMAKAMLPNVSCSLTPWYEALGSDRSG